MFHRVRAAIQSNVSPGQGEQVTLVEGRLRDLLMGSGVFEEVEVEHTEDPDQLVIALCQFRPFFTERDVARKLEEIWSEQVRYPFWESHGIRTEDGYVEFEAATRPDETGPFVTVHLVAERAGIPAQRAAGH